MTQIELEAGLAQIEADYSGRVEVEAKKIADNRIRIEQLRNEKELAISQCKMEILSSESIIRSLNSCKAEQKASLLQKYKESCARREARAQ